MKEFELIPMTVPVVEMDGDEMTRVIWQMVKDELIQKLEHELADVKTDSARRSTFLMNQIDLKDQRIDKLMSRVDEVLASNRDLLQQIQRLIEKM